MAYMHVQNEPEPPSRSGAAVPPGLEAIIMRLLAKDPDDRYPSAEDLRADLRRFREGQPVEAEALLASAAPAAAAPADAVPADAPPKSRVGILVGALVVLFVVFGGLLFLLIQDLSGGGRGDFEVPNVVGEEVNAARARLEAAGFDVATRFEENEDFEPNVVFDQDPRGGSQAESGSEIVLLVSSGADAVDVPEVVGIPIDGARIVLLERGFQIEERQEFNRLVPPGEVFRQDPEPGQRAPRGSVVTVFVSRGPEPVEIPDVAGQPIAEAAGVLGGVGFLVTALPEPNEEVPVGMVIRTDPPAGQLLIPGETVTAVVSTGAGRVQIPDLANRTQADATALLQAEGMTVVVEQVPLPFGSPQNGLVVSQYPEANIEVDRGAVVIIRIGVAGPAPTTTTTTR
jgi:serine/threonine-protein kinase